VGIPQTFIIPTIDADNDQVRCRFANDSEECASVCHPGSLPNGTIMTSNCTFSINGSNVADWYAVAIVIKNFINSAATSPLSSIHIQFLINLQNQSSCPDRPRLTGPLHHSDQCSAVKVSQTITAVEAEIHRLDSSIQEKQELYKRHLLDDDQFKQMGWDLASRLCLQIDLEELKAERDRRASQ
ncbi:unnamed protein product, partial [Adineta ricciae]